jgi:hypothetical protein
MHAILAPRQNVLDIIAVAVHHDALFRLHTHETLWAWAVSVLEVAGVLQELLNLELARALLVVLPPQLDAGLFGSMIPTGLHPGRAGLLEAFADVEVLLERLEDFDVGGHDCGFDRADGDFEEEAG